MSVYSLTERRAIFVYEATRLAGIAAKAPVIPASWEERDESSKAQYRKAVERQCSEQNTESPDELHESWMQSYIAMGWTYGPVYDPEQKTHPDLVPYSELDPTERNKDEIFMALCEIARKYIRD